MFLLHKFDRNNTVQHNENFHALRRIEGKVDKLDDRIHGHIGWHVERESNDL